MQDVFAHGVSNFELGIRSKVSSNYNGKAMQLLIICLVALSKQLHLPLVAISYCLCFGVSLKDVISTSTSPFQPLAPIGR